MWLGAEVAMKPFDEVIFQDFEKELTTLTSEAVSSQYYVSALLCKRPGGMFHCDGVNGQRPFETD